jgi:hypothetical protein
LLRLPSHTNTPTPTTHAHDPLQIEGAFWFSVGWSLGANLDGPSRAVFNTFLRRLMSGKLQVRRRSISHLSACFHPVAIFWNF